MTEPVPHAQPKPAPNAEPPRAQPPTTPGPPYVCDLCGFPMLERHCKIVCPQCGYLRDCSDP